MVTSARLRMKDCHCSVSIFRDFLGLLVFPNAELFAIVGLVGFNLLVAIHQSPTKHLQFGVHFERTQKVVDILGIVLPHNPESRQLVHEVSGARLHQCMFEVPLTLLLLGDGQLGIRLRVRCYFPCGSVDRLRLHHCGKVD